ncbi:hypothetical protein [Streptomyces flavalbus]|uniref:Sensor domain-containing protein n=1 Tax=Streptomyces flavalbus TaxID=2665155 RepID=A0ABW2W8X0_9ACTN
MAMATATASASLLLLLTACGGGTDDGDAAASQPPPSPSSSSTPTASPDETEPGTETEGDAAPESGEKSQVNVEEVILTQGDLAEFQITESPGGDRDVPPTKARPASCQPVENLRLDAYAPAPTATARRFAVATTGDYRGTGTTITLTSFTTAQAEKMMADLRAAVTKCASGYAGGALTFSEVRKLDSVPVGDEAVSFHLTGRANPTSYTLVRQGSILIRLSSAVGTGGEAEVPQPVMVQQVMKIQAAEARDTAS